MKFSTSILPKTLLISLLSIGSSVYGQFLFTVDFEFDDDDVAIGNGQRIDNEYADWGINFEYVQRTTSPSSRPNRQLWTFDTSAEINEDDDLETPGDDTDDPVGTGNTEDDWKDNNYIFGDSSGAKNVLIIQEDHTPSTNPPDDDWKGGIIRMTFDNPITFKAIGILDIDDNPDSFIRLYSDSGASNLIDQTAFPALAIPNNSYQEGDFGLGMVENVRVIDIDFASSGAISGIQFIDPTVIPEPSTYALIFGGLALGVVFIKRRLSKDESSEDEAA